MSDPGDRSPSASSSRNLGLLLFALYVAVYGAYVGCSAFAGSVMAQRFAGISLAIWWGLLLILLPLVLAALYLFLARREVATETQP